MDAREGGGPAGAVRTPDRPDAGGPACYRPSDRADDESGEQGDAEAYAVLGED
ncbi:hypothetical protein ACFVSN_29810 [Kitasatospora sp. NPDC057904]|uniref:hypothetical protein n=1 Tax=unclassified Kitasatospora TaxID=2633591 RepID=UPI0036D9359B